MRKRENETMPVLLGLLFDGIAMLGVYFVAAPFAILVLRGLPRLPVTLLFLLALSVYAAGWGMQHLICCLTRYSRPREGTGYEKGASYYRKGLAWPVWGIAALVFVLSQRAVDAYLYSVASTSVDYLYDAASAVPAMVGTVFGVLFLLGGAVRFYPYTRVLSLRACMTDLTLFLIGFVLGGGVVSAFCLFCFALGTALLLNQNALEREIDSLSLPDVPERIRFAGMRAVLRLSGVFAGCAAVMSVIVGGGMMVGRVLLFMLFQAHGQASDSMGTYRDEEETLGVLYRYLLREEENAMLNLVLMVLFLLGVVGLIVWFALRRNDAIRRWLMQVWNSFAAFLDWIFGSSTRLYYRSTAPAAEVSYRDEVKRLKPVGDYSARAEEMPLTWRAFRAALSAQKREEDKLIYAYGVLAAVLRAQPIFPLLRADTPRRIEEKVRARGRHDELHEITAVYETVRYAERSPGDAALERALTLTCRLVREYLN